MKDALGSAIALADASGNVQTSYTYEPFGGTSVSGAANANEFQYTAREAESNGLYYYRGRYYNSLLERFTSEIEWAGSPSGKGSRWVIEASDVQFHWIPQSISTAH